MQTKQQRGTSKISFSGQWESEALQISSTIQSTSERHTSIIMVGVNHHTAPIDVREAVFRSSTYEQLIEALHDNTSIREALLLSTCNRIEVYAVSDRPAEAASIIRALLLPSKNRRYSRYINVVEDLDAIKHLYLVASGIDSLVIGEPEILLQVRRALKFGLRKHTVKQIISKLFLSAVEVGAKVRRETGVASDDSSVSHVAQQLIERVCGGLSPTVLLLGTGKMMHGIAAGLRARGVSSIIAASSDIQRSEAIARRLGVQAITYEEIPNLLASVDVVVTATLSDKPIISAADVRSAVQQRNGRGLLIVDIAVPRNVDPEVGRLESVKLYNIDDLRPFVSSDAISKRAEIEKALKIVDEEVKDFERWLKARRVTPVIKAWRKAAERIRQDELNRALRLLRRVDNHEKVIFDVMSRRIVNKLLHKPTIRLRQLAVRGDESVYPRFLEDLFRIDEVKPGDRES